MPTTADNADDLALVRKVAAGSRAASRELVLRLMDRVRTTVTYLAGADRDLDDMVQLSLLQILGAAGSFRGESKLESWADRITVRTALRALKRRRKREAVVALDERQQGVAPDRSEALVHRQQLAKLLQRLPPERRTAVILRWVHQYSIAEIAEITGARVNTVRDRLRTGKKELRALLLADEKLRAFCGKIER